MLTKEQIVQQAQCKPIAVPVAGFAEDVYLAPMSIADFTNFVASGDGAGLDFAAILALSWTDADGVRLFGDDEIDTVRNMRGAGLPMLATKAAEINGLTEAAAAETAGN